MASVDEYPVKGRIHYRVRWYENGKKKSRTAGPNKTTLKALVRQIEHREVLSLPSPLSTAHCVKEFMAYKKREGLRPNTLDIYERALACLGDLLKKNVNEVIPQELEQLKVALVSNREVAGANMYIRDIKAFFKFCLRLGHTNKNPAEELKEFKPKKVARFFTRDEIHLFYKLSDKPLKKSIYVLYNTGMRKSEFLGVNHGDIGTDYVLVNGKTGIRKVPLKKGVRAVLKGICGYWSLYGFNSAFRRMKDKADIGRVRVQDMRHTFASAYLKSGGTLADLKELGGWASLKTLVDNYAHFQRNYLAERMVKVRL